ncbi:MAG: hypothetical protein HN846_01360 [Candidatus Pacebacteria bacterium]|jgi:hypothetical protein|nr:hypothetical protein [Candidatus Paceibacterota bacterium]MBT3511457.1 hypothetical protein [Candidatus Paceibacterota bacterium]MBT4004416.1 hypothetical protein [Candidatus Paceibacterota bacterium]MBT4358675.1 hypothetical protein [Candidatus Paceibacterota bacterium]MBT4680942.1 hypothetical protein [Candidatus Paceibacterota bacterium]
MLDPHSPLKRIVNQLENDKDREEFTKKVKRIIEEEFSQQNLILDKIINQLTRRIEHLENPRFRL